MKKLIILLIALVTIIVIGTSLQAQQKKPQKVQKADSTLVLQSRADIIKDIQAGIDQLEAKQDVQNYKFLKIQLQLLVQIQDDSLLFKKQIPQQQ